ncbi:MAG: glycosyltransferase family 4 protein [Acidimicrobiales bacterium]|nr:glycosyltransferase family 4 protein [Acidimicrobiales bacterium]
MRVGLVSPYSLTRPGGVQGQVLGLARSLRLRGHDVRVLGPCDGAPPEPDVIALGNSMPIEANGSVASLAPDPSAQLRTIGALWDENFDVVHLHEPFAPGPTSTALLVEDAPLVGTFHAAGTSQSYRYLQPILRYFADWLSIRVAVSKDARALAAAAIGGSFELLFNGVEVERYAAAAPWPTEVPTIVFIGRHEPRKGLAQLLEAVQQLSGELAVWVLSEGPQTNELRQRYGHDGRIRWLGRVTEEEKARRLAGADVFCAPSLGGESFGVVLAEAMAAGTAVVASDLAGYRNAARPDREGLLVAPGDVVALRRALREVLDNEARRGELVEAGRLRAASLSMARLAACYEELYTDALTRGPVARPWGHRSRARTGRVSRRGR